jgi:hypothetical protein
MSMSKLQEHVATEDSERDYIFIRIARWNTDLHDYITVGFDATNQICFHRKPDLDRTSYFLIQTKDTGMFASIDLETNLRRILDPEYENDIYHFFYMEFSAWK